MCVMCEMTGRDYYHTHNLPISEVTTINGSPAINNLLSSHSDGTVMKYTVSDIGETVVNYILGTYIGQNGSGNHLININTQTLLG